MCPAYEGSEEKSAVWENYLADPNMPLDSATLSALCVEKIVMATKGIGSRGIRFTELEERCYYYFYSFARR